MSKGWGFWSRVRPSLKLTVDVMILGADGDFMCSHNLVCTRIQSSQSGVGGGVAQCRRRGSMKLRGKKGAQ